LEIITVLGIMSILFAVAVPKYVALQPGIRLNGAAREILAQLMWARAKAVEQNNNYVISLPNNHSLSILDDKNNNGALDAGESTKTIDIQTDYYDATVNKGGGQPDPTFYPRGTAGGNTTLTVSNSSGSRTVTVSITGVVKIN
jgi:type IV fimbrial biogenesis protein FimT